MMRRRWMLAGAAVLATGALVTGGSSASVSSSPVDTARIERGDLAAAVALNGTLTYRARPDGSPWPVTNQARGIYTDLPEVGDAVGCGEVLYRVDDQPVRMLCGSIPAYRKLEAGDHGRDVRQLNRNLRTYGSRFTLRTAKALGKDELDLGDIVVLPTAVRVAKVTGVLGGPARAGAKVADVTSGTLEVQVSLAAAQQGTVKAGDRAQVTLPGNRTVPGRVSRLGRVARTAGKDDAAATATIPASIALGRPRQARGLDSAPVQVEVRTTGVKDELSVPVLALVGKPGGGFAVEVERAGGRRELVAVRLGLFDTTAGRVEVSGVLAEGDAVVVPAA
jgi:hypothetical protein